MKKFLVSVFCVFVLMSGVAQADLSWNEYLNTWYMANLSARVYDNLWDSALDAIAPALIPTLDFEGNTEDYQLIQAYTAGWDGFDAKLYRQIYTGEYVLCFRGTEALAINDWIADVGQVLNDYIQVDISQYRKALTLAQSLKAQYGNNLQITGHSLGGGLAQVAALGTGLRATCFNAAGLTQDTLEDLGITTAMINANRGKIKHFNVQYDPLSDFDGHMNSRAPFSNTLQYGGATYWLDNIPLTGGTWNPFRVINHFYHSYVYQLSLGNFL